VARSRISERAPFRIYEHAHKSGQQTDRQTGR